MRVLTPESFIFLFFHRKRQYYGERESGNYKAAQEIGSKFEPR